jgi:hypothetical protein
MVYANALVDNPLSLDPNATFLLARTFKHEGHSWTGNLFEMALDRSTQVVSRCTRPASEGSR